MRRRRPTRARLLEAALLALVGAVAVVASTTFHGRRTLTATQPDIAVNAGARDPGDIKANNSPTLAQNPLRPEQLAIVNRVDTPAYTCGVQISDDRGARWKALDAPIPRGEEPKCFAPDVTFAADGTLHVSYVTLGGNGNEPHAAWVTRSDDGGRTLAAPTKVLGPRAFQVRLTADPERSQRLYLTWLAPSMVGLYLFGGSDNEIRVARSDDGGRSWGRPVRVSAPQRERVLAPSAAVGPGGALYVLYLDAGEDRLDYEGAHNATGGAPYGGRFALVLGRSTDAGASWQESLVDDAVVPTRRFIAFLPPFPSLAVDPRSGTIFVAFEDGARRPADVHLWSLARGSSTWEGPRKVNDTPPNDRSWQYLPKLAVAPGGRLDAVYLDRRNDRANLRNDVSLQSSFDSGRTFTAHVTLTDRSFDARIGAGSERNLPDLGSRLGLVSEASSVLAAWTDTRAGTVDSNKQDIAFSGAVVSRSGGLSASARSGLRYGGVVLLLAAVALLLVPARRRGS